MFCLNRTHTKLVQALFPPANAWRGQDCLFTFRAALHILKVDSQRTVTAAKDRLKREDLRRTRFDHYFDPWKVLIGPTDWQDYARGKDGVERYRKESLTSCPSNPGVYELGVLTSCPSQPSGIVIPDIVIPAYLGMSKYVRTRLQQHGRYGTHLENVDGLFSEIFSLGCSIAFRVMLMDCWQKARKFEVQLLNLYDYALNVKHNGMRRPHDIHKMLDFYAKCR